MDISVKGKTIPDTVVAELRWQLNEETVMPYHFDVLNYYTISNPDLADHINRIGILFYEKQAGLSGNDQVAPAVI